MITKKHNFDSQKVIIFPAPRPHRRLVAGTKNPDSDPFTDKLLHHYMKNCYQPLCETTKITLRCNHFYFAKLSIFRASTLGLLDTTLSVLIGVDTAQVAFRGPHYQARYP